MDKRILNVFVIILSVILFIFPIFVRYNIAYAYTLPSNNSYGYSADEARAIVNNHETIYTKDGKPVFIYMNDVKQWLACYDFDFQKYQITDDEVVDIMSSSNWLQYNFTSSKYSNITAQIHKALGVLTGGKSDFLTSILASNGGELTKGMTYDKDNGITILSDTVDKLREEIKKQYCDSIGLNLSFPQNTPQFLIGKLSSTYEHEEDYISDYNNIKDNKFIFGFLGASKIAMRLNFDSEPSYLYVTSDNKIVGTDSNLSSVLNFSTTVFTYDVGDDHFQGDGADKVLYIDDYKYRSAGIANKISYDNLLTYMDNYVPLYYYSDGNNPLWVFRSYEALYNYVKGSQTAYLSSKIEEKGEDIKISIDDMNTNISSKMDELIDSINNKKDGMTADELQNAIDKGLENISGKMDDIKDNTQETNAKLDSLLSVMQSQNEILMNILGVTTDIYNIVSSKNKEDGSNYTISDLQPHFNKCFSAVKNMVLYGVSSFDDVDTQTVDNDVGISIVSVDSSYIMANDGLIDVIGGRSFYKFNSEPAYVCTFKHGNYWGPLLVSESSNAVAYKTCGNTFSYNCTVEYASKTWYVSSDEYSMPNYPSQTGFARVLSSDSMSSSDAALLLLKTAGVTDTPVVSPDYPEDVVKDYHNGLLGKFPFSVPYQLYEWLQVLQAEPKTPEFSYDYGFMLKYFGISDIDTTIKFDLSQYDDWAQTARSFLKLSFTLAVAVGTYRKFKGVF